MDVTYLNSTKGVALNLKNIYNCLGLAFNIFKFLSFKEIEAHINTGSNRVICGKITLICGKITSIDGKITPICGKITSPYSL